MPPARRKKATALASTIAADAKKALAGLRAIAGSLPLETIDPERSASAGRIAGRVPRKAIEIALSVLELRPDLFETFDARVLAGALAYEDAMTPLAAEASAFSERATRNIRTRLGDAASQVLGLYQYLKGIDRLPNHDNVARTELRMLRKLLTTNRPRRATAVTKTEEARETKALRTQKLARVAKARAESAAREAEVATTRAKKK